MKAKVKTIKIYKVELDEIETLKLCEEITTLVALYPIKNMQTLYNLRTIMESLV